MGNVAIFKGKLVKFLAKAGILIPKRATTDRSLTPEQGETAFNTTDNKLEVYNGSSWVQLDASGTGIGLSHPTTNSTYESGTNNPLMGSMGGGTENTAIGVFAGNSITSGLDNTLMGVDAGTAITTAGSNTFIGAFSGKSVVSGSSNVAVGRASLRNYDVNSTVAIGSSAGVNARGGGHTLIGEGSDSYTDDFSYFNTAIGRETGIKVYSPGVSGTVSIGTDSSGIAATATASNQFVLGTTNHLYRLPGKVTTPILMAAQNEIRFGDADSSNYVGFKSQATVSANEVYELPTATGTVGQVLGISSIPATGTTRLAWTTASGGGTVNGNNITGPIYSRASGQATKVYSKLTSSASAIRAVSLWTTGSAPNTNTWNSICWSSDLGLFAAVSSSGTGNRVATSPDGITWTPRISPADNTWTSVCWSSERRMFVAVSSSGSVGIGRVMVSYDGIDWSIPSTVPTTGGFSSVLWNSDRGEFIAGTSTSTLEVMTSTDGLNWTRTLTNFYHRSITWSPELSLYVAADSIYGITKSSDGIIWTQQYNTVGGWQSICWSPDLSLFVAVANSSAGANRILTSPDGTTWTLVSAPAVANWSSVVWSAELGLFLIGATSGATGTNAYLSSPDGVIWTSRVSNYSGGNTRAIVWCAEFGRFIAIGTNATEHSLYVGIDSLKGATRNSAGYVTSSNSIRFNISGVNRAQIGNYGIYAKNNNAMGRAYFRQASNTLATRSVSTWTARTASVPNQWTSVCWSPELSLFCAVAYSGTNDRVMTSPDGITWTSRLSAADNEWNSICWSPELGLFVAVAVSSATSTNKVMTSPDGSVWSLQTPSNNAHEWQSVCWSPELGIFVAVAGNGVTAGNRAMWSNNGITWTAATTPADNAWRSVCWSSELGLFVAVASSGIGNRVMTSTNGTTWTIRSSAADHEWRCVTWSPDLGMFCALPYGGTSYMTSVDGITWTSRTASAISVASLWTSITWSKELGLFCGIQDQLTNGIITSPDGLVWTTRNAVSDAQWQSICWASEKGIFVGVGTPGTGALVQTSKYVGVRGITSY